MLSFEPELGRFWITSHNVGTFAWPGIDLNPRHLPFLMQSVLFKVCFFYKAIDLLKATIHLSVQILEASLLHVSSNFKAWVNWVRRGIFVARYMWTRPVIFYWMSEGQSSSFHRIICGPLPTAAAKMDQTYFGCLFFAFNLGWRKPRKWGFSQRRWMGNYLCLFLYKYYDASTANCFVFKIK